MNLKPIIDLYNLHDYEFELIKPHDGGRNIIYKVSKNNIDYYVIRISNTNDRSYDDYLAETEFVHYLKMNKCSVADVIPSINNKLVEQLNNIYVSLFEYAEGILISDNGYRYIDNKPLSEYFYNTGKVLGRIHHYSKLYKPIHKRIDYFDKYNNDYIKSLINDIELYNSIINKINQFKLINKNNDNYGLVHYDYSDGNYHINYDNGNITVFDFDNSLYTFYMFDLANLWTHGIGWIFNEYNPTKRKEFMDDYFNEILKGYQTETNIDNDLLNQLSLFIDMVLIENIIDEAECAKRDNEELDYDDIEDAVYCIKNDVSYIEYVINKKE